MVYIFDIDGTLAKSNHGGEEDISSIPPNKPVLNIALAIRGDDKMAVVTARPDSLKGGTLKWIKEHKLKPEVFLMRKADDLRPDHLVRVDQVRDVMGKLGDNVVLFDDKPLNCSAVKKALGIPVIHVK